MRPHPLLAALLLVACSTTKPAALAPPHSTMRVHFIDVGQGAATLFEFDDGAVLVDTGGEDNDMVLCKSCRPRRRTGGARTRSA